MFVRVELFNCVNQEYVDSLYFTVITLH